jgi:hypothetical protein
MPELYETEFKDFSLGFWILPYFIIIFIYDVNVSGGNLDLQHENTDEVMLGSLDKG